MQYQDVQSSNIAAIAHENGILGVRFTNGSEYHYEGVASGIFDQLISAASVGRIFNELIKSHPSDYPFSRVA